MHTKQKNRWLLDASLFAGLILASFVDLTGVSLHQWIGILAGAIALYHLVVHIDWVDAISARFFGRIAPQARLFFLIDAALLVGFFTMIATGLVISTWLGLSLSNYTAWRSVHIAATTGTLVATFLKIILHRNWILQVARKWVFSSTQRVPGTSTALTRREFMSMMGVVGAATFLALGQTVGGLQETSSQNDSTTSTSNAISLAARSTNSSSGSCAIQCGKRCSYPGRCRRYIDTNGNNRCDLGECI